MAQRAIVVDGRGGLPDEICRQLRLAGAAGVQGGPYAADAAESLLAHSARERPAAVVLVSSGTVAVGTTTPWQRAGVLHLPVTCDGRVAVVGPLVVPGTGSCWRCHALTAHDLDSIGAVCARHDRLDRVTLPSGSLGILTAAVTATVVLAAVAGASHLAGVSTEIDVEGPTVVHRHWGRHPLCADCAPGVAPSWRQRSQDTMAR
jgi:bacteriocin biosynthesis cyclodehydratase domain-containing protein